MKHITKTSILALTASLLSLSAPAQATDIFTDPARAYSQEVAAPVNWAGLYVGGSVGYGIATLSPEDSPFGGSFESPLLNAIVGFDVARDHFVFGPFAEYTYITADEAENIDDWAAGVRAGVIVAPRTLLYGSIAYAQLSNDDDSIDGLRVGLGTEFAAKDNVFVDAKVNYTWYDLEDANSYADAGDLRALLGLKIKLNSDILK